MKILDLFSGIGGFSLGMERAGHETVAFCEIDKYATKVLKKHWPNIDIHPDIKELTSDILTEVDIICGGFPCQDISLSGEGKGLEGERSGLWFEYLRLIKEVGPSYVVIENVSPLRSRGLSVVLQNLSEIGYDAEWHCIPASYLGAPHERDRIWIIAYPNGTQLEGESLSLRIQEELSNLSNVCWGPDKPGVVRTLNGIPKQMDRLKCLGNSIIPQIAEAIGRVIKV